MNSGSGPAGEQLPGFAGSRSRGRNRCACGGLVRLEPHVSSGARKVARCQTRLLELAEHKWPETAASDTHRVRFADVRAATLRRNSFFLLLNMQSGVRLFDLVAWFMRRCSACPQPHDVAGADLPS